MSTQAKPVGGPDLAARSASPAAEAAHDMAATAYDALGYEAADPALHAPYWHEWLDTSGSTRNLR